MLLAWAGEWPGAHDLVVRIAEADSIYLRHNRLAEAGLDSDYTVLAKAARRAYLRLVEELYKGDA